MKIGLVADTFSVEKGTGIGRYSQELLGGLRRQGLDVETISPESPNLPLGTAVNHALKMPYLVQRKSHGFDVVHATSPITALAFPLLDRPRVVTYHDLVSLVSRNTSSAFHARLFAPLFFRIGQLADRIIAISSQTRQEMIDQLRIPDDRISVVNYGISQIFRPLKRETQEANTIGYVGPLGRRKALDYLLRAVHLLKKRLETRELRLVICGSKNLEYPSLLRLASALNIDEEVEFRGFVAGERLVRAYSSFDVYVQPSEWEGFGMPILEAQRCGVPVIIRKDAHIPTEVSKCCLEASSEEDMANKIYELLTNEDHRQTMIEEGLEYSQQFTWTRAVQQTLTVYEKALS